MGFHDLLLSVQICLCFVVVSSLGVPNRNEIHSRTPRQVKYSGCILPEHPEFGKWLVYQARVQPDPGTRVPSGTILQISCQNHYKLDGDAAIVCINDRWTSEIGRCLKTCPPLYNTPLISVTCIYNSRRLENCTNAIDGTVAKFTCADFYEDKSLERNPVHVCFNGKWSNRAPECVPICGQKSPEKDPTLIVGGSTVPKGNYPWQVAIYEVEKKELICGGSLLNQRVVLTAAHCVTYENGTVKSEDSFMLAVGKYYRNYSDSRDNSEAQFSPVYKIHVPRQYRGDIQNFFGDIAVLITKKTFTLSLRVQPVCVDWASNYPSLTDSSRTKRGHVSGWGYTTEYKNPSEVLKELEVPLISDDQCNQHLPDDYSKYLTDDKLCAGFLETGTSVCSGDSGGGLVVRHSGRYYVIAVVSLSPQAPTPEGGCDSQQYALYTRVSYYINIILEQEARFRPSILGDVDCEEDPHCKTETSFDSTSTTVIRPARPGSGGKCLLPNHPSAGQWTVFASHSNFNPGMSVSSGTLLKITCKQGYQLVGQEVIMCEKGRWTSEIGLCLQSCPPLQSGESVRFTCTFRNNEATDCKSPVEGTIARHRCAPFYEDLQLAKNPVRVCRSGSWNLGAPECIPVCGLKSVSAHPLIVNGTVAKKGDYPWHVGLYRGRNKKFTCNGALISQKVILTAAHCVMNFGGHLNPKEIYTVAVGKYYRDFYNPNDNTAQTSDLQEIFIPLQYGGIRNNYIADIAVLVAEKTFTLSQSVQPVCVDWALKYDLNTLRNGYISGWGYTTSISQPSEELRELRVPLATKQQCLGVFSPDFARFVTHDKLCAGYVNMSTSRCKDDSGAALVMKTEGRHYVIGIASITLGSPEGGCDVQKYSFYTKVADYNNFILEKDAQFRPSLDGDGGYQTTSEKSTIRQTAKAECILPQHPRFGKWAIYGSFSQLAPGASVALGTVLQVSCEDQYVLEGDSTLLCEDGKWSSDIGTCLKTCPPVHSTPFLKATCIIKGEELETCATPSDGALVKYECAAYYEDKQLARNSVHICRDGSWDHKPPQCVPICGQKSVTPQILIVNGSKAKKGEYPWQVAIYREPKRNFICSGSLITERIILTAAHCVTNFQGKLHSKDSFTVAVGKYYRNFTDPREELNYVQFSGLSDMYVPTQYQGHRKNFRNNIAVLVASSAFALSRRVQPVCVDWSGKYENLLKNSTGYVAGWGHTSENGSVSDELRELQVPLISQDKCSEELPQYFLSYLGYDNICAGYRNRSKSVCSGDSGGGLVVKFDSRYYISGIVTVNPASGRASCDSQEYGLYTKVSTYVEDFISQKVALYPRP